MILARRLGGSVAALCFCLAVLGFCLTGGASAAPVKTPKVKRHAATPARTQAAVPASPAVPSPSPAPGDVILYGGSSAASSGLTLAAFGGGAAEESTDPSFVNGHSVKVTTLDAYQGATLTFGTPLSLGDLSDKTRYLAFTLRLSAVTTTLTAPPAPMRGGMGRGGRRGYAGMPGLPQAGFSQASAPAVQNIHLILTLANGAQADLLRPLPSTGEAQTGVNQWVNVAVPVSALGFPAGASSPLQSVTIAGDDYAVMYVGQIKITGDDTPITCFAGDQQTVAVGQPLVLTGSASGGLSALHYAWTLDDAVGTPEQASGPAVTTRYLNAGDHKVTLTVSDPDGIKKPATATTVIHVQ